MSRKPKNRARAWCALALALLALLFAWGLPRALDALRYPVRYEGEIRGAAAGYGLSPALVAAIAHTESGYNPRALSRAGAMGLMQIMPETGRWIAGKLGEGGAYDDALLYTADASLRYGCWYLNFLLSRYEGDMVCAVAAYHAGQGAVDRWLGDRAYAPGGHTLVSFPEDAPNTRQYVVKVQNAYEYYEKAYR